jgi:CRP-like cAMP-binding protein
MKESSSTWSSNGGEQASNGSTPEELFVKVGLLGRLPLFSGCTSTELRELAQEAYPIQFEAGEKLCVAGAHAPECYVITEGEAAVTVGKILVDTVRPLDVVGERGPITGRPRAATVTAKTPIETYAIGRSAITALLERSPTAAASMRDELLRRYG